MYDAFFAYARERYWIHLKRQAGLARPWTEDPILHRYKFCQVFREDDRTTIWLRQNVREKLLGKSELLLATILFRWFNRITTGEAIFCQNLMYGSVIATAWEVFSEKHNTDILRNAILTYCGSGPYVTGAYCIIGMPHMTKLDGILACVRNVVEGIQPFDGLDMHWEEVADTILDDRNSVKMEEVWDWFRRFPRSGDFMAYEIVTDLQHSLGFLDNAPDRMTWANAGPGAIRGLARIHGRVDSVGFPIESGTSKDQTNAEMRDILSASQSNLDWPIEWPRWDMRTVEHTLCEFDKYERLRLSQGTVKGVYRG